MARETIEHLCRRVKKAREVKGEWRDLLSDAYEYGLPQRNLFKNMPAGGNFQGGAHIAQQGQKKVDRVFDSTASTATIGFANRIQSDLMPPFQKWIKLSAGPMVPEGMRNQVNRTLEFINDQLFAVLSSSNFDTAINELLLDLAVGTGAMLIFEDTDPEKIVVFVPVPLANIGLEEGAWGRISMVTVEHHVRIDVIEEMWPGATLSKELEDKQRDDPNAEVDLVAVTYQDKEDRMKWRYEVIYEKNKSRLYEETFEGTPWVTPRWVKVAGEVFGRGPLIFALPDIKTLNKIVELVLKNAALHIAGVYTGVNDGVLNPNTASIRPGMVIPVGSNGGTRGPSLKPLERTGSFDLAAVEWEKLVMQVKTTMLDNRLPPESAAVRSATEIVERVKELVRDIGAPFGRLMTELIVPMVQRILMIMARRNLITPVKVDGLAVQVTVLSPLAQVQNLADVENVVRWLSINKGLLTPQAAMLASKEEDIGAWFGEKLGVPQKLIRSDDEREKLENMAGELAKMQTMAAQGVPTSPRAPELEVGGQAGGLRQAA